MAKVLIICALQEETKAVLGHLTDLSEDTDPDGLVYVTGKFESDSRAFDVYIVEAGQGNTKAASLAAQAIGHVKPNIAMFVGIAGAIKDLSIGDVIAADKIYGYHAGKADIDFLARPDSSVCSTRLVQRARAVARSGNWLNRIRLDRVDGSPAAIVGPIAAGEQVVSSKKSETFGMIRRLYNDAIAVEMEGKGFLESVANRESVRGIVIRGISDQIANKTKSDRSGSQILASAHAAAFAFELLATLDDGTFEQTVERSSSTERLSSPLPRSNRFVGRESELRFLRDQLLRSRSSHVSITWIHGLTGVGKSQLAAEYFESSQTEFDHRVWISAADAHTALSDFVLLADLLGISRLPQEDIVSTAFRVIHQLERTAKRILFVFDNVEMYSDIAKILPRRGNHQVIVTSVKRCLSAGLVEMPLDVFNENEAVEFLLNYSEDEDTQSASVIASLLGSHPLALDQCASFCRVSGSSLSDYLVRLMDDPAKILDELPPGTGQAYERSVVSAILMSLAQLEQSAPDAMTLLNLLAFAAQTPFPISPLSRPKPTSNYPPFVESIILGNDIEFSLANASALSLVVRDGNQVAVHPMVQLVMRSVLGFEDAAVNAAAMVEILYSILRATETLDEDLGYLLPHILQSTIYCHDMRLIQRPAFELLMLVGTNALENFDFVLSKWAFDLALDFAIRGFGDGTPDVAYVTDRLATSYQRLGDFKAALPLFRKALQDAIASGNQKLIATCMGDLGLCEGEAGNPELERELTGKALEIAESIEDLGSGLRLASLLTNSADDDVESGRYELADQKLTRAELLIQQSESASAIDRYHVAVARSKLLFATEDYERVHSIMQATLDEIEEVYGSDSVLFAQATNQYATFSMFPGMPKSILVRLYERLVFVLETFRQQFGGEHIEVARVLNNLGQVLHYLDLPEDAIEAHSESLRIKSVTLEPDHHSIALTHYNLALIYESLDEHDKAKFHVRKAHAIRRKVHGDSHPETKRSRELKLKLRA